MNFLNVRVIVNGREIYILPKGKPVLIPVIENHPKIVATDGFHITNPMELVYRNSNTHHLQVVCAIDNNLLITGVVLLLIFSLVGLISDIVLFQLLSVAPILYFLFYYYFNKKEFIHIKAVQMSSL